MTGLGPLLLSPWAWLAVAAVFGVLELAVPGIAFIWLALAAVLTAAAVGLFVLPVVVTALLFAELALIAVIAGRRYARAALRPGAARGLNRRAERMVGAIVTVSEPIAGGAGAVMVGDSPWRASGPDMPAGARARVVALDGATLTVAPVSPAEWTWPEGL